MNQKKTKVIHFRTASVNRSTFDFKCGDKDIEYTSSYKYLGLWLHEHLNLNKKVQVGKDQEKAQSEKDSHSKNRGGKKPN